MRVEITKTSPGELVPGEWVEFEAVGFTPSGQESFRTKSAGFFDGIRPSEWTQEEYLFVRDGFIGDTPQSGEHGFPTAQLVKPKPEGEVKSATRSYYTSIPVTVTVDDDGYVTVQGHLEDLGGAPVSEPDMVDENDEPVVIPDWQKHADGDTIDQWVEVHTLFNDGHAPTSGAV